MKLNFKPHPKPKPDASQPKPKPQRKPAHQPKFKPQPGYIYLTFALAHSDFRILQECAQEKGLGEKAYSAALRLILREWKSWVDRQNHPVLISLPPDMLPNLYHPDEER